MADSVFKQWEDKVNSLTTRDFEKGVLEAIHKLKEEIYNLKVDNINQKQGRVIRDDRRIVLSAPEIIIGDVNLGGMLNSTGYSKVTLRANDVCLQGVGEMGQVDLRAPIISQIGEDPGADGNEHVIGDISQVISQARNITIESDNVEKDGTLPQPTPSPTAVCASSRTTAWTSVPPRRRKTVPRNWTRRSTCWSTRRATTRRT